MLQRRDSLYIYIENVQKIMREIFLMCSDVAAYVRYCITGIEQKAVQKAPPGSISSKPGVYISL